jgi:hypothetical protein
MARPGGLTVAGCFGLGDALELRGSIRVVGSRLGWAEEGRGKWVSRSSWIGNLHANTHSVLPSAPLRLKHDR